tara:strand:+ start:328 stop:621 length:294 start_codon:yes stop_codon:yes gene_type:complete
MANKGIHKHTVKESSNLEIGQLGFDKCTANADVELATVNRPFMAIYNPNDTEVIVSVGANIGDTLTSKKIGPNCTIYGNFSSIRTMSPGKSTIGYRA